MWIHVYRNYLGTTSTETLTNLSENDILKIENLDILGLLLKKAIPGFYKTVPVDIWALFVESRFFMLNVFLECRNKMLREGLKGESTWSFGKL